MAGDSGGNDRELGNRGVRAPRRLGERKHGEAASVASDGGSPVALTTHCVHSVVTGYVSREDFAMLIHARAPPGGSAAAAASAARPSDRARREARDGVLHRQPRSPLVHTFSFGRTTTRRRCTPSPRSSAGRSPSSRTRRQSRTGSLSASLASSPSLCRSSGSVEAN
uniref:Uncharacterized protein n=1 Tax=Oryza brachyantha TaxID=4533 RepID=J3LLQ5_ORYBR